jgi:hypothetical protein
VEHRLGKPLAGPAGSEQFEIGVAEEGPFYSGEEKGREPCDTNTAK